MATAMVTDTMAAQAQVLLARSARWLKAYEHGAHVGYSFPSSRTLPDGTPVYHLTRISPLMCSCPGHRNRGVCSHSHAVAQHQRTVEAAQARYQQQATATTWRRCVRPWCEALVAPESLSRFCDHCAESNSRLLATAFGEDE